MFLGVLFLGGESLGQPWSLLASLKVAVEASLPRTPATSAVWLTLCCLLAGGGSLVGEVGAWLRQPIFLILGLEYLKESSRLLET